MARPRGTAGGRPVVVCARFSTAEAEDMDRRRGSLTRTEWLRFLAAKARREGFEMPEVPEFRR